LGRRSFTRPLSEKITAITSSNCPGAAVTLTDILITIAVLGVAYFAGVLRPTGLLARKRSPASVPPGWLSTALPDFLILAGIVILWTAGYLGVWSRLQIGVEGTVTSRQDFPRTINTHGPTSLYSLQQKDGSIVRYTATESGASLPRTIPVGASITKHKWELSYLVNDAPVDDFPLTWCVVALTVGFGCLIGAIVLLRRERLPAGRA
jgi:hypothetical protein